MNSLDKVIKEEAEPAVEKAVHRAIGITIKELNEDITLKLKKNPLLEFNINTSVPLKSAKKSFRKGYIEKVLRSHYGDITAASRILQVDRKTIHRMILELGININECRRALVSEDYVKEAAVSSALTTVIRNYEGVLHPSKISEAYANADRISEDIVKDVKFSFIPLKEAEREFEREFISAALKENNNSLVKTAKAIKISHEALYRKAKSLGF